MQKNQFNSKVERVFLDRKINLDKFLTHWQGLRINQKQRSYFRLQEEEATFAELALSFSEGIENLLNGLIGPIEFGKINLNCRTFEK